MSQITIDNRLTASADNPLTAVSVKSIIDGTGKPPIPNGTVVSRGSKIDFVGRTDEAFAKVSAEGAPVRRIDLPGGYLLPGLIDSHVHVMFGEPDKSSYEDVLATDSDEIMLLRATKNALTHLRAGVTTMRENGARNRITFHLREGSRRGYIVAPRLLISGRPITVTGGHFYWCGQEADGENEVRKAVRQLVKEGADHIKIMASGGGTVGTDNRRAYYSVAELRAIVDEAHLLGRPTTAHCIATQSIANALDAGVDMIEHAWFVEPDGGVRFDPQIAERIAQLGTYISPTIAAGFRDFKKLLALWDSGQLSPTEKRRGFTRDGHRAVHEGRIDIVRKLWSEFGVPIVSGTDAIWRFGDYCIGLELLAEAGMSNKDVIQAATSVAAKSMGVDHLVGTIEVGKAADMIVVDEDPLQDIRALREMRMVMLAGTVVKYQGEMEEEASGVNTEVGAPVHVGSQDQRDPQRAPDREPHV